MNHHKRRPGLSSTSLVAAGALISLIAGAYFLTPNGSGSADHSQFITSLVRRGPFSARVVEQGSIQSTDNVNIRSQVVARNGAVKVIDVIAEGAIAKAGDWLLTLDGSQFVKELEQKRLEISNAATTLIQAKATFDTSAATKEEYVKGTFFERKKQIKNTIFNAKRALTSSKDVYEYSKRLQARGYITVQKLTADEFAVSQAKNSLDLAIQQLDVLVNITRRKELIKLESDIDSATISLENAKQSKAILERQLTEIQQQLAFCKIHMPKNVSGEVVYAKERDPDSRRERLLARGATVRERQVLIQIPDRSKMEVEVLVSEQDITSVRTKMTATIRVDALKKIQLRGVVAKVSTYAAQGDWSMSSSVKKYAVIVRIDDPPMALKSGMNATVSIQTLDQADVLQVPLQCVYSVGDNQFVFRIEGTTIETIDINVAGLNSSDIWITGKIQEGDKLLMDPGSHLAQLDLPERKAVDETASKSSSAPIEGPNQPDNEESEDREMNDGQGDSGDEGDFNENETD